MADKKKMKKKKDVDEGPFYPKDKPPKPMTEIAKWMKKNVPTKKTKFLYHQVNYFIGSKAVDALMETKWAKPKKEGETPLFTDRAAVTEYLDLMLRYKFFHRAKKIAVSDAQTKKKKKDEKKDEKKEDKKEKKKGKSEKSETEEEEKKAEEAESSQGEGKEKEGEKKDEKGKEVSKGKEKRKIRLDMHLEQMFLDTSDAYVWIYDPIPLWYWAAGTLVVIATVGLCLFPLWPPTLRKGVYYLSIAAAGFLLFILGLAVLRFILFCLVWAVSLGKHHFWLLPNLTEDVGFFASFWPLYQYEYKGKGRSKQKKKKKKAKDSDAEDENEDAPQEQEQVATKDEETGSKETETGGSEVQEVQDGRSKADDDKSETESEGSSQKSQVGKDFEIVEKEEGSE